MHLPRKQTVFIDGLPPQEFLRPYSWQTDTGGWQVGFSQALVCPVCLRVWAKLHMEGHDNFVVRGQPCAKHPTTKYHVAGSLIVSDSPLYLTQDMGLWEHLPENLLRREFDLILQHADRYL